ncbi:MAG: DUF4167 domain-containing protein [Sphingomonadaceae bacterium]
MLNNRQAGRRRGRGNQRPQGNNNGGRGAEQGNRIDNRARGNAPQMLEKYNMLARDAQQQGDRVMAEYYLQFADHYFRVVADSRARFEENRPRQNENGRDENGRDENGRDDWQNDDAVAGEGDESEDQVEATDDSDQANERQYQQNRQRDRQQPRQNNYRRDERDAAPRDSATRNAEPREDHSEPAPEPATETATPRPRRGRAPRIDTESNGFDVSILPPAISTSEPDEKPAPKPRGRKPKLVAIEG